MTENNEVLMAASMFDKCFFLQVKDNFINMHTIFDIANLVKFYASTG